MSENSLNNQNNEITKDDVSGDNIQLVETALKDLLDKILTYFEKFIRTKEDLDHLEAKLDDYENLQTLAEIIKNVFEELTEKIDERLDSEGGGGSGSDDYFLLEKALQKCEAEIRTHIGIEQQMKLWTESLQSKLDDSEKQRNELLESTKNMISAVKKDNQKLSDTVQQLNKENENLQSKIKSLEELTHQYEEKLAEYPTLQARVRQLEKIFHEPKLGSSKSSLVNSVISNPNVTIDNANMKKLNLEVDCKIPQQKTEPLNPLITYYKGTPLRIKQRSRSESRPASNMKSASEEIFKVQIEITKDKNRSEQSRFNNYNSVVTHRENRQMNTLSKIREARGFYNAHNTSSNNLSGYANTSGQMNPGSLSQRSNSIGSTQKLLANAKAKDLTSIYIAAHQESLQPRNPDRKSRYL